MKVCTHCHKEKPLTEFRGGYPYGDGHRPDCLLCQSQVSRIRQKRMSRELTIRKKGTTEERYNDILAIQGSVCALCGAPPGDRALPIDHDHVTGNWRGILCATCNGGLGMFRDDPVLLERAAEYLRFWKRGWEIFEGCSTNAG